MTPIPAAAKAKALEIYPVFVTYENGQPYDFNAGRRSAYLDGYSLCLQEKEERIKELEEFISEISQAHPDCNLTQIIDKAKSYINSIQK